MTVPEFSIKSPISVLMMILALVLLGAASWLTLGIDLFPNIDFPVAFIQTPYPGVDPSEMENIVTRKIEEEINTVENVKKITSYSFEGFSQIVVEFNWGTNIDLAAVDLREKVDIAKRKLPRDIEQVTVAKFDINAQPIMNISMGGRFDLKRLRQIAEKEVKPALERIQGIANVEVFGGLEREIRVKVFPEKLKALNLSINDVIFCVSQGNMNTPVGNITEGNFKYLLRSEGEVTSPKKLGEIVVKNIAGRPVFLSEIARIEDSFKEIESVSRLNLKPAVSFQVKKEPGANPVAISDAVKKIIPKLENKYPDRINLTIGNDGADFIKDSLDMVSENAQAGAILSIIVLFLFFWNVSATIIIGVSIPLAIVMTFGLMYLRHGMTLNLLTLGGLALGIGMIVDNAIVVLENVYRHMLVNPEKGIIENSITASNEVILPVTATTLTHIVVFLPIGFVPGWPGQLFINLSMTIVFSLLASYVVALTLVPVMTVSMLRVKSETSEPLMDFFRNIYVRLLKFLIGGFFRRITYAAVIFVAFFFCLTKYVRPPSEFFPKMDRGVFSIKFEPPEGTSIEKTDSIARRMEEILSLIPEREEIVTDVKLGEGNITVKLKKVEPASFHKTLRERFGIGQLSAEEQKKWRLRTTAQIIQLLRPQLAEVPGYVTLTFSEPGMGDGGGSQKPVQIEVSGDDYSEIEKICLEVTNRIKNIPGLKEIDSGVKKGRPEVKVEFDRAKLGDRGLDLGTIAGMARSYIFGTLAGKYKEANEEYDVRVEAADEYKSRLEAFKTLEIILGSAGSINVSEIAKIIEGHGFTQIERKNLKRLIKVQADLENRAIGEVIPEIRAKLSDVNLPPGYQIGFGGEQEEMGEAFRNMSIALFASILLVYMIMASQFESLIQPFVIMFTIPLSIMGVNVCLNLYHFNFSIMVMIGLIMLAGLVVANGIILIDYMNRYRKEKGAGLVEAALKAGSIRLRPIVMTFLTTILGMLPLSFGYGAGADFYQGLAIAVIGGMTVSTFLTLTFIPVVYVIVDDIIRWKWVSIGIFSSATFASVIIWKNFSNRIIEILIALFV
ncbi:MAG: efflux RND transporter permease subunit [Candidatus Riflebacteria bacterium]|nr:efflux RND transporter permease subunit [Candidatus Riflebacteria bacterium]